MGGRHVLKVFGNQLSARSPSPLVIDLPILKVCTLEVAALNTHLNIVHPSNSIQDFNVVGASLVVWFGVALPLLITGPVKDACYPDLFKKSATTTHGGNRYVFRCIICTSTASRIRGGPVELTVPPLSSRQIPIKMGSSTNQNWLSRVCRRVLLR